MRSAAERLILLTGLGVVATALGASWQLSRQAPAAEGATATLLAAGDIADCEGGSAETARLLREQPGVIAALGDLAYPDGSAEDFARCYAPTWGTMRDRTRPAIGNHEMHSGGGAYFDYFGALAGPEPEGYYSYDLGAWHVIVLNSNCRSVGGCGADSAQVAWLRDDLAATSTNNVLAYWHSPRYSTGSHGDAKTMDVIWDLLVAAGADVVLSGHSHDYQRFTPLDADGRPDPAGIRLFVVGTGGAGLSDFTGDRPTVEYRQNDHIGILRVDLETCGYRWAFLPAGGGDPLDRGAATGTCDR